MKPGSGWCRARPGAATLPLAFSLMSIFAFCRALPAVGQDVDHAAVLELGAAVARATTGPSPWQGGGTVAVEFTPIEEWLEIEIGASALRGHTGSELSADFLLKKPYRLSSRTEFSMHRSRVRPSGSSSRGGGLPSPTWWSAAPCRRRFVCARCLPLAPAGHDKPRTNPESVLCPDAGPAGRRR
jgi:hypothetical protein